MYPIKGFPMDGGLWWLRWFDHPAWDGTTSTATVTVVLTRLHRMTRADNLPLLDAALAARKDAQITREVHTGLIPALAIGTVYCDGSPVGQLKAKTHQFRFERAHCVDELLVFRQASPFKPLFRSEASQPASAVGREAYALNGFDDSLCLRIRSLRGAGEQLVIPCPEVFRTLLAPHRAIALALTHGPWKHTHTQVVHMKCEDPEKEPTRVREDGSWHIALAGGVGPAFAVTVGNLILNPAGRRAANLVWVSVIERPKFPRDGGLGDRRPSPPQSGRLRAQIPFEWDVLDIEVRGFWLSPGSGTWIGLEIVSLAWPPPPWGPPGDVWWTPWKDTTQGPIRTPVDKPEPYGGVRETDAEGGHITKEVGPSVGSQAVPVEAAGPLWRNSPRLHRKPKVESHVYLGSAKRRRKQETSAASAGNAVPGPTGAVTAQAKAQPRKPGSTRFAEVLHMFERLRREGYIESFEVVAPNVQEAEHRGNVPAWRFPRPPHAKGRPSLWFRLDPEMETTRAAMVCAVRCEGVVVHWIEIELRPKESGYRSLLFTTNESALGQVVLDLLRIAVREKGVWPGAAELVAEAGALSAEVWTHSQVDGRLNGERALAAIRAVIAGASAGDEAISA